ncbi:MAG: hypothetical protein ED558_14190 [Oricola sp.]|jgi:predicted RecA/RadA family phage recombinase|nr:MAG: hypothetical protein ED558_14190 [Oricola sp.]
MAAVNDQKIGRRQPGTGFGFPVLAGQLFYGRTLVAITAAGMAVKPDHADAAVVVGLSEERVDNSTGADGDITVEVEGGVWNIPVAAATVADIGATVYAVDDNTLQLTNAGGELPAGILKMIDADGHWVDLG